MNIIGKIREKRWWIIGVSLLVLVILWDSEDGIGVSVITPAVGTIHQTIPANGKVRPVTEVHITPDVSGEIVEIFFQEGDFVHKGDLLLKIKPDIYLSLLDQATAALNGSKAQFSQQEASLRQAKLHFERSKLLLEKGAIALSEYEEAESSFKIAERVLESARYQVQSATASVREARENLAKTSIYSPMDGIISQMMVEKGERVVGTSQMAGTEILRVADFSRMEISVEINENDIIKVERGDTASVEIDAFKGQKFSGIVTQVANSAKSTGYLSEQITSFEVNILLSDDTSRLRPGMSATIAITTEKKDNIITIPLKCINSNGCIFVVRDDGSTVEERRVITGIQDINNIEIIDGLSMEEMVVSGPYDAINRSLTDNGKIFIDRDQH